MTKKSFREGEFAKSRRIDRQLQLEKLERLEAEAEIRGSIVICTSALVIRAITPRQSRKTIIRL